ncbi:hypothetical protein BGW80DRAFT_1327390, partial [Lactifluus volemus]
QVALHRLFPCKALESSELVPQPGLGSFADKIHDDESLTGLHPQSPPQQYWHRGVSQAVAHLRVHAIPPPSLSPDCTCMHPTIRSVPL